MTATAHHWYSDNPELIAVLDRYAANPTPTRVRLTNHMSGGVIEGDLTGITEWVIASARWALDNYNDPTAGAFLLTAGMLHGEMNNPRLSDLLPSYDDTRGHRVHLSNVTVIVEGDRPDRIFSDQRLCLVSRNREVEVLTRTDA